MVDGAGTGEERGKRTVWQSDNHSLCTQWKYTSVENQRCVQ